MRGIDRCQDSAHAEARVAGLVLPGRCRSSERRSVSGARRRRVCPSGRRAVSLPGGLREEVAGPSRTERDGCGTELVVRTRLSSDCRGVRRLVRWLERPAGRAEGPRRGTKPREGRDAGPIGNGRVRVRTRRRSNAPKSRLRVGGAPRCSSATVDAGGSGRRDGQRQGGNGHGDVVRLPARIPSRGVKRAARMTMSFSHRRSVRRSSGSGWGSAGNAANPMTGSGMQQARDLRAEETVEVVRNHADGT
jgi:hypothetical protein